MRLDRISGRLQYRKLDVLYLLLLNPITNEPENQVHKRVDCVPMLLNAKAKELRELPLASGTRKFQHA